MATSVRTLDYEPAFGWSALFIGHSAELKAHCSVVEKRGWRAPTTSEIARPLKALDSSNFIIVVLNSSGQSFLNRLAALFFRRSTVSRINAHFQRHGVEKVGIYALYPNIESSQITFELGTSAGCYAENYLLTTSDSAIRKKIDRILAGISGCSPQIDVIAVVGRKG